MLAATKLFIKKITIGLCLAGIIVLSTKFMVEMLLNWVFFEASSLDIPMHFVSRVIFVMLLNEYI